MTIYLYANNAKSSLLGNIGPTDAVITLPNSEGARFPNPTAGEAFKLTIEDTSGNIEIIDVTARTADTLTVVRGREGTTARSFSAGTSVEARITAGILSYLDWQSVANDPNGPAVLDNTGKLPIGTFDTPLQVYGDNRWNLKLNFTPVQQGGIGPMNNDKMYFGWSPTAALDGSGSVSFQHATDATLLLPYVQRGVSPTSSWTAWMIPGTAIRFDWTNSAGTAGNQTARLIFGPAAGAAQGEPFFAAAPGDFQCNNGNFGRMWAYNYAARALDVSGTILQNGVGVSIQGHTHTIAQVSGLQSALDSKPNNNATNTANITFTGTITGGAVVDSSDINLKSNRVPMSSERAETIVRGLKAWDYFYNPLNRQMFGGIAQEMVETVPELVTVGADGLYGVQYGPLVMPVAVVVQKLLTENDALKARVAALEAK